MLTKTHIYCALCKNITTVFISKLHKCNTFLRLFERRLNQRYVGPILHKILYTLLNNAFVSYVHNNRHRRSCPGHWSHISIKNGIKNWYKTNSIQILWNHVISLLIKIRLTPPPDVEAGVPVIIYGFDFRYKYRKWDFKTILANQE